MLWRPVDAQYLGEHQALADNELILWAPGQPLVSTLRRPDGGPAEVWLPRASWSRRSRRPLATESPCSTYVLTVRGYEGYRGQLRQGRGVGEAARPTSASRPSAPPRSHLPHRVLYVIPRAVVDASAWYGVWTMVAIAALVLVPALVWLAVAAGRQRHDSPSLALSKASARVAQGELGVVVQSPPRESWRS